MWCQLFSTILTAGVKVEDLVKIYLSRPENIGKDLMLSAAATVNRMLGSINHKQPHRALKKMW